MAGMKQLDIFPNPEKPAPSPQLAETTKATALRLMAQLLLELVSPHDDSDPGGQNDE
jgi:hypothetical protein